MSLGLMMRKTIIFKDSLSFWQAFKSVNTFLKPNDDHFLMWKVKNCNRLALLRICIEFFSSSGHLSTALCELTFFSLIIVMSKMPEDYKKYKPETNSYTCIFIPSE